MATMEQPARTPLGGVLADLLEDNLLGLTRNDRLWKLYFLRPTSEMDEPVEHRIYTKLQEDGKLGLVSYSIRMAGNQDPIRSQLAYSEGIPEDTLNNTIWNVVQQTGLGPDDLQIIDLGQYATLQEQIGALLELASMDAPKAE
ncbi:MAG: hypothetical protein U9R25_08305 [Chloroflexota bacterium]|nr:hypothetical protein [Chloroflexota bacterium]